MYDIIYTAICDSELDCQGWDSTAQHQLAKEIVQAMIEDMKKEIV